MNEQNWFGWLDNKSEDNLIWAVTYLIKKGGLKIDDRGQRASPQEHIDHYNQRIFPHSFYSDEKKELFIKKMKAALSQRKNRSKLQVKSQKSL
jgi:hypothetical protein